MVGVAVRFWVSGLVSGVGVDLFLGLSGRFGVWRIYDSTDWATAY